MKTSTIQKVPIMDVGFLGEKDMQVKTEMIRKYTFAALVNCPRRDSGAHESIVYLVVRTLFYFFR